MIDEERLGRRIAAAYERLPGPELVRLDAIESRVVRSMPGRRPARRFAVDWYWWLVVALFATGAAAWWTGHYFFAEPPARAIDRIEHAPASSRDSDRDSSTESARTSPGEAENMEVPPRTDKRPLIYRRERY